MKNRRVQEKEKEKGELEAKLQKIQEENVAYNSKITVLLGRNKKWEQEKKKMDKRKADLDRELRERAEHLKKLEGDLVMLTSKKRGWCG